MWGRARPRCKGPLSSGLTTQSCTRSRARGQYAVHMDTQVSVKSTGLALKLRRERQGLSRTSLAELAGVDRRDITRLEQGVGTVSWEKAHAVMRVLDVQLPHAIYVEDCL